MGVSWVFRLPVHDVNFIIKTPAARENDFPLTHLYIIKLTQYVLNKVVSQFWQIWQLSDETD